jgi:hypothetical protein
VHRVACAAARNSRSGQELPIHASDRVDSCAGKQSVKRIACTAARNGEHGEDQRIRASDRVDSRAGKSTVQRVAWLEDRPIGSPRGRSCPVTGRLASLLEVARHARARVRAQPPCSSQPSRAFHSVRDRHASNAFLRETPAAVPVRRECPCCGNDFRRAAPAVRLSVSRSPCPATTSKRKLL